MQSSVIASHEVQKLVEYRTAFYGKFSELSIYETNQPAQVGLKFGNPVICRMTAGKKIMTLPNSPTFTFLPGETIMVSPNILMDIEFPVAKIEDPTECVCIEVESEKIDKIVANLNENRAKVHKTGEWKFNPFNYSKFKSDPVLDYQMDKLMHIFVHENNPYRDSLIDLSISELIIRILQTNARNLLIEDIGPCETHAGLAAVVHSIKENPDKKFPIEELSSLACMSQATLYRHFKLEFGVSPTQFVVQVKIKKACVMLQEPSRSVTDICFELGFSNVGHFIKRFRLQIGVTPKKFQQNAVLSVRN